MLQSDLDAAVLLNDNQLVRNRALALLLEFTQCGAIEAIRANLQVLTDPALTTSIDILAHLRLSGEFTILAINLRATSMQLCSSPTQIN